MEEKRKWTYDAFISYRHTEPDAFVAGALHKYLESYKLPSNLKKEKEHKGEPLKREKINKIFRDAEELPLTNNLNDTIMEAINDSEYLIVICSPRLQESLWCRKEIETFIEKRGVENVFAVLVEGEPSESFPKELLFRNRIVVGPDGTVQTITEPVEPLAANVRGNSDRERMKLLKTEALRLMAPIFGCGFDDLKQRHREQKMKRTIRLVSVIAIVCFAFATVSTGLALRIRNQNSLISKQNEQITNQAEQIEQQYREALVSNAISSGEVAEAMLDKGDRFGAISKIMEVYPGAENEYPYIGKNEKVLTDALWLYEVGSRYRPAAKVSAKAVIDYCILSPEGTYVAGLDKANNLYVWETKNGEQIFSLRTDEPAMDMGCPFFMPNEDIVVAIMENGIKGYDIHSGEEIYSVELSRVSQLSGRSDIFLAIGSQKVVVCNSSDGAIIKEYEYTDETFSGFNGESNGGIINGKVAVGLSDNSSDYAAFAMTMVNNPNCHVYVIDTKTGDMIREYIVPYGVTDAGTAYGNKVYVVVDDKAEDNGLKRVLYTYDLLSDRSEPIWVYEEESGYITSVVKTLNGKSDTVAVGCYSDVVLLDDNAGTCINTYHTDDKIISMYGYENVDNYMAVTERGTWGILLTSVDKMYSGSTFESVTSDVSKYDLTNGIAVASESNSNDIVIYRIAECEDSECITASEDALTDIEYGEDRSCIYAYSSGNRYVIDTDSNTLSEPEELSKEMKDDMYAFYYSDEEVMAGLECLGIDRDYINTAAWDDKHSYFAVQYGDRSLEFYKADENGNIDSVDCSELVLNETCVLDSFYVNDEGNMMVIKSSDGIYILDLRDKNGNVCMPSADSVMAYIFKGKFVDFENNKVYILNQGDIRIVPFSSREELAVKAIGYLN